MTNEERTSVTVFHVAEIVDALQDVRRQWRELQRRALEPGGRDLPAREALAEVIETLKGVLFPMRLGPPDLRQEGENFYVGHALDAALHALLTQARGSNCATRHATQKRITAQSMHAPWPPCEPFRNDCRRSAGCSTTTCLRRSTAIPLRAASTRCCSAIRACWR